MSKPTTRRKWRRAIKIILKDRQMQKVRALFSIRNAGTIALLSLSGLAVSLSCLRAEPAAKPTAYTAISPIFSQLVAFSQPSNFVAVYEDANAMQYMLEAVPKGETVEKWTQMITVTGAKDLAANTKAPPAAFADVIAGGFKKSCPKTYSAIGISNAQIAGHDAFAAVASCGSLGEGKGAHSETTLIVAIRGARDYYTIQWSQRSKPSSKPIQIDDAAWTERFNQLAPIRLCPIVKGEKPPYPSCVTR